jgi:non-heme chloroperoxidase
MNTSSVHSLPAAHWISGSGSTPLHVRDWGSGRPIVFVHAWALNGDIWEYQTTALVEQGFRCIAFDRRGHGLSPDPGVGYDYDTLADDLDHVVESLNLRDAILVGHSMGCGEIATYLRRLGTDRVSRVVLIGSVGVDPLPAMLDAFLQGLRHDRPGFLANGISMFFGENDKQGSAMVNWVLAQFLRTSPLATRLCAKVALLGRLHDAFAALRVPVLLIHGGQDQLNPLEQTGARIASIVAGAQLVVYEDAPHGLIITHRERLIQDLLAFARA